MRLIKLALALVAVSFSWAAMANPAVNSNISGSIAGTVGVAAVSSAAAGQMVAGQAQARLDGGLGANLGANMSGNDARKHSSAGMDDSMPRGWLMLLVAVLLIGHQLRRKHRFLRPHRFGDV
jgi:hypothetical protein